MHVLLGDVFRQKRMWYDAEEEYRKAAALDPKNRAANISLAIVLFAELKDGEAYVLDRALLAEDPNDPEANLLAGEILVQQNRYAEAEPYLSNCKNLKPEFRPRLHALLGRVYAESGRISEAIQEYKAGLSTDEDGSLHYQLARLYQKTGDKNAADEAFKESRRLSRQRNERGHILPGHNETDSSYP
jgi:predicted Zn-dependent protease